MNTVTIIAGAIASISAIAVCGAFAFVVKTLQKQSEDGDSAIIHLIKDDRYNRQEELKQLRITDEDRRQDVKVLFAEVTSIRNLAHKNEVQIKVERIKILEERIQDMKDAR